MDINLRIYAELNEFLPRHRRQHAFYVPYKGPRSVKDLIEAQGVPHTEVGLMLINGAFASFEDLLRGGDRVAVYPMFSCFDLPSTSRLASPPLRAPSFVADVHLGKLVRRLRLLGIDCLYDPAWDDEQLARICAAENRVLLSRDVGLLKRRRVIHGMFLHVDQPTRQVQDVFRRYSLKESLHPLSRCLKCNGKLQDVSKQTVYSRVPERTRNQVDRYRQCSRCGKVYWQGAHWNRLQHILRTVLSWDDSDGTGAGGASGKPHESR